eukprot:CAMPEP_0177347780 /NCGR_PEP_ID=MMETSP0368-20130122/29911_1 /TAXON_ID=447022 ORGANISM="Scrippsiella hangoei-like, Strain SHHI-4" /NCGR_SAMPLE_ID=MMETSP0368 /ASSEMBLY_ACC=CAM_ASM_000363 /LENGTH=30 /DNA_ID= /DNA_START= /DNA_END= /DNA_ORIENTATION=
MFNDALQRLPFLLAAQPGAARSSLSCGACA